MALTALVVCATPADAQRSLAGAAAMAWVEHRVDAGTSVEISSGVVFAGSATLGLGSRMKVTGEAKAGVLRPNSGADLEREFAEIRVRGAVRLVDWLSVEGGVRRRAFTTSIARQLWTILELGAAVRVPFAVRGLYGLGSVGLQPLVSVSGGPNPKPTVTGTAGIEYALGRVRVQLVYSLEPYDFRAEQGISRLEQLSTAVLRVSVPLLGGG